MDRYTLLIRKSVGAVAAILFGVAGCQQVAAPALIPGVSTGFEGPSGKLKPKQAADVQIALARSLEMHGDADKAFALYEEAVAKDPSRSDAWLRLAILHDQQGQFAESATLYQKALKTQPGSAEIYCDMGYSLYLQDRWSEAEMNLRQALTLQPDHARAHNNLGLLLARSGKVEEALEEFHRAGCRDADAHINLAFALTLQQHWPQARQQYQEALQADPSSLAAQKGLRELDQLIARRDSSAAATLVQPSGFSVAQVETTSSAQTLSNPTHNSAASTEINPVPDATTTFATSSPH